MEHCPWGSLESICANNERLAPEVEEEGVGRNVIRMSEVSSGVLVDSLTNLDLDLIIVIHQRRLPLHLRSHFHLLTLHALPLITFIHRQLLLIFINVLSRLGITRKGGGGVL